MATNIDKRVAIADGTYLVGIFGLLNKKALAVAVVDGDGNQVTSFAGGGGSGTQYAEGATAATGTGTLAMGKDGTTVRAIAVDSSGALFISGSVAVTGPLTDVQLRATPVPVSGTVTVNVISGFATSANQSTEITALGTLLSELQLKADLTDTQPVSVATLPLPTGAATAARQDTGNTSLASIDGKIIVVDTDAVVVASSALPTGASTSAKQDTGNASLASIDGKITAVNTGAVVIASSALPSGAATSAKQDLLLAELQLKADLTDTQPVSLASVPSHAVTNAGTFVVQENGAALTALQIIDNFISGSRGLVTEDNSAAIAASASVLDDWDETDRAKVNLIVGQAGIAAGTGVDGATVPRVTLATNVPLPAGTNAIGKLSANSGVDIGDVDILSIAAGANAIGNVGIIPRTSGGLTIFRSIDLDETEEEISASACQLFGWYFYNATASTIYVKVYNATAASVTVGSTTPVLTLPVPAYSAANCFSDIGIVFGTALTLAATTGIADADTGAPAANALIANVFYK